MNSNTMMNLAAGNLSYPAHIYILCSFPIGQQKWSTLIWKGFPTSQTTSHPAPH